MKKDAQGVAGVQLNEVNGSLGELIGSGPISPNHLFGGGLAKE